MLYELTPEEIDAAQKYCPDFLLMAPRGAKAVPFKLRDMIRTRIARAQEREAAERAAGTSQREWRKRSDGSFEKFCEPPASERFIHGIATTADLTTNDQMHVPAGVDAELPVPLLFGHEGNAPFGDVFYLRKNGRVLYFRAALHDTEAGSYAWALIESGEVAAVSIGSANRKLQGLVDGKRFYSEWSLKELSLTRSPANSSARFEIWDGRDSGKKFFEIGAAAAEPIIRYKGVWDSEQKYSAGQFVTDKGSLWHAEIDSTGCRPGEGTVWKMCAKAGRDRYRKPGTKSSEKEREVELAWKQHNSEGAGDGSDT